MNLEKPNNFVRYFEKHIVYQDPSKFEFFFNTGSLCRIIDAKEAIKKEK